MISTADTIKLGQKQFSLPPLFFFLLFLYLDRF